LDLLTTRQILEKFKKENLTRGKIYYMQRYGRIKKVQEVINGKTQNFYDPKEIASLLKNNGN
jgi:hypothetical protein